MDEECTVLTSYLSERQRTDGAPSGEALIGLYARQRTATSILLRGIEGSGRQQPRIGRPLPQAAESALTAIAVDTRPDIEAALDATLQLARPRLVTIERARLLSGEIEPVRLGEEPGDATRLTVYCRQRDRAFQIPAFEAACELLYRRRIAGATVLSGVDGADPAHSRPQHGQFLRHDADVPLMVVAIGAGDRIAMLLPELGAMFRRPLMTIEKVRLCKRDGQFVSRPDTASGPADARAGMTAQFKLTVYTSEAARHDGHPVHRAIVASLNSAGISGATTVRGIWGYHGDHAPHGDHFPRQARHVPVVTTVIAAAEQISAAFDAIDAHTAERGLVTAGTVLAMRPTADAPSPALPRIRYPIQPGRRGAHPDHDRPRPFHRRESGAGRERVGRVRRDVRPDFENDLGMPGERDRGRCGVRSPTVHEHGDLGSGRRAERREPGAGQRLSPRAEQVGEREPGTGADEHQTGRVECHQRAVAPGAGDQAVELRPGLPRADPGRQQQHPVGGEHLDVHADPRAERSLARPRDRAAGRRREPGAGADRPRLAQQCPRDRRGREGPGRRLRRPAGRHDGRRRHRQNRDPYRARSARRQPGHRPIIRAGWCASPDMIG